MAHFTLKARIDAVLQLLRSGDFSELEPDIDQIAAEHGLEPWVVRRLCESEGLVAPPPPKRVGSEEETGPLPKKD